MDENNNLYFDFNASYAYSKISSETFGNVKHILTPKNTVDYDLYWENKKWNIGANVNKRTVMYVDMANTRAVPESLTLNLYGFVKLDNMELGLRCNNITNRVNYCTGVLNAYNEVLYAFKTPVQ